MALVIEATAGHASANSYVTAAEMTAYCESRRNASVWTAAAAQESALTEATRTISLLRFKGSRTDATQALEWPRTYCPNPDVPYDAEALSLSDVVYIAGTIVPTRVKNATCELALQFLKAGTTDVAQPAQTDGVIEKTVDVITTKYAHPAYRQTQGIGRWPLVRDQLAPLLADGGGSTVTRG